MEPFGDSLTFTTFHVVSLANDELDVQEWLPITAETITAVVGLFSRPGLTQKRALSDQKKFVKIADER